jgi:hypothetical protein
MYKKENFKIGMKTTTTKKIIKNDDRTKEPMVEEHITERDRYVEIKKIKCCGLGINFYN